MLLVAKQQYLKTVPVQITVKMMLNVDSQYPLSQGQELAKGHPNRFLAKVHVKASLATGLIKGIIFSTVY